MNKDFQDIFNRAEQVKLSSDEKKKMWGNLELFIAKHSVRNATGLRHLLQERSKSYISAFAEILTLKPLISKLQPMAIILIIALFVGGGTSFAAESALPGDILYPIKVSVNEEVRSFVAISNEAQAEWDARRAERRLEEAEKLAAEGRLNAETRADIESRFESHAEAFQERAKKMETKQDAGTSLEIQSNFEASLKAHEQVLAQIAAEKANVRGEVGSLLIEVRTRLNATVKARINIEAEVSAEADGKFKTAAEGKLGAAENKISEVRGFIARVKSSVSASAYTQAETRLKVAESVVARGKIEVEAQSYGKAFASFQEAIRIAQEAKLLVATEERIKLEIKIPSVDIKIEGETKGESGQGTSSGASVEVESKTKVESGSGSTGVEGEGKVKIDIEL
ncbi:MAG: DUF5667 domain-containing protein [Patescibacteria group bacterium]